MVKVSSMEDIKTKSLGGFSFKCPTLGNYPSKQYCVVVKSPTGALAVNIISLVLVPATEEYKEFKTLRKFKGVQLIARHTAIQVKSLATILEGVKQLIEDTDEK